MQNPSLHRLEIGRNIRRARVAANLTQSQLAERVALTPQMIQKYEKGLASITLERMSQIATAAGLNGGAEALLSSQEAKRNKKTEPERSRPLSDMELSLLKEFANIRELSRKRLALQIVKALGPPSTSA